LEHSRARIEQARAIHELLYLSGVEEARQLYTSRGASGSGESLSRGMKQMETDKWEETR